MTTSLFELDCRAYEIRERYLENLKSYQGTDEEQPGDVQKITNVERELVTTRSELVEHYRDRAVQWLDSRRN